jgi:RNA polymerase sigma-70 factor (ECF subfamily)
MEASDDATGRFRALFEAELDYVRATVRRLGVAPGDVDDVTHEVFLRVHRHWGELDPSRPPRPWIFVFALRQASDYRRLARHRHEQLREPDAAEPVSSAPGADELVEARDQRAIVEAALLDVELDRRVVLLLHDLQETPMAEIAELLEIPLQTAYSRLRVGREELVRAAQRRVRARGER